MKLKIFLYSLLKYQNRWELLRSAVRGKETDCLILPNGIHIYTPPHNDTLTMVKDIFFDQLYTNSFISIGKNDRVVDIGANIGIFTLWAAVRTQNQIDSFEPFPGNHVYLSRNIQANGFTNIKTHPTALSDQVGTVKLYLASKSGGNQIFHNPGSGELHDFIPVPSDTLKNFMDQNAVESIDFLKMDCEGAEGAILNSTPLPYLLRIRQIAMEFHDNVSQLKHGEIRQLLLQAGFKTDLRWDGKSYFGYIYAKRND